MTPAFENTHLSNSLSFFSASKREKLKLKTQHSLFTKYQTQNDIAMTYTKYASFYKPYSPVKEIRQHAIQISFVATSTTMTFKMTGSAVIAFLSMAEPPWGCPIIMIIGISSVIPMGKGLVER